MELKEIVKNYIKVSDEFDNHKCKYKWCPTYDIECEKAQSLFNQQVKFFELMRKEVGRRQQI